MANLLATKPLNLLMEEARETGEHSLKRTLGSNQSDHAGNRSDHRRGHFCADWSGCERSMRAPAIVLSFVLAGIGMRLCRPMLCGVCRA